MHAFQSVNGEVACEPHHHGYSKVFVGSVILRCPMKNWHVRLLTGRILLYTFNWTQNVTEVWRRSNNANRREILDSVCLNRELGDLTLVTTKRKPFDIFAERLVSEKSRDDKTAIELFIGGVRGWEAVLRRQVNNGKSYYD